MSLNPQSIRALHSAGQNACKTVLYGWGQTQALPLTKGHINRVFNQPTCLKLEADYALPKESSVTHMATGWGHSLLGTDDRSVYGFGLNQSGQLGTAKSGQKLDLPEQKLKFLACGREHSHIVTENELNGGNLDTSLYSFGNNMYGQLGLSKDKNTAPGTLVAEKTPTKVHFKERIHHITCGLDHTILATEHELYGMGWSADGQLGQGKDDRNTPSKLPLSMQIDKLSTCTDFSLALGHNGQVWTWGNSEYGQGVQGKVIDRILEPLEVKVHDVVDIAAGGPFSILLTKDGSVHSCGYGALGLGRETIHTLELKRIEGLCNVIRVFAATDYAAAITASGDLYTWGLNGSGRLALGNENEHAFTPKRVNIDRQVIDVSLGTNHALAICID